MEYNYHVDYEFEQVDACELNNMFSAFPDLKTVVIYGAGQDGRIICEHFESCGVDVLCFCDRDSGKQDRLHYGKPVISPEALFSGYAGTKIIVSVYKYRDEIIKSNSSGHGE